MSDLTAVENFGRALARLREFAATPVADDRDRAGIIQAFEFTFEQCWKALRQIATSQGIPVGSPRQAFQAAMQMGLIRREDEQAWLDMLGDRNITSHVYQESAVLEIAGRVVERYLPLLDDAFRKCG